MKKKNIEIFSHMMLIRVILAANMGFRILQNSSFYFFNRLNKLPTEGMRELVKIFDYKWAWASSFTGLALC